MYKSPIEILNSFSDSIMQRFAEETDKLVLTAMYNIGVTVDKAELIKALEYDRDQYEKGYRDGKESATVHAHWRDNGDFPVYNCSNCCDAVPWAWVDNHMIEYCPFCGAIMDAEDEGDK